MRWYHFLIGGAVLLTVIGFVVVWRAEFAPVGLPKWQVDLDWPGPPMMRLYEDDREGTSLEVWHYDNEPVQIRLMGYGRMMRGWGSSGGGPARPDPKAGDSARAATVEVPSLTLVTPEFPYPRKPDGIVTTQELKNYLRLIHEDEHTFLSAAKECWKNNPKVLEKLKTFGDR